MYSNTRERTSAALVLLLLVGALYGSSTTGGNVTNLEPSKFSNTTKWDGIYGEIVLGVPVNYTHTVTGNKIVRINMIAKEPPCAYSSISIHVIAYNSSALALPLSPGNIALLDALIGNRTENATITFKNTSIFKLSTGTYAGVPTTYTYANSSASANFRMGYLNDANGNIVFVTKVANNSPDWNGSTSDYQMLLPRGNSPVDYNITTDVTYTCKPPPTPGPSGGGDAHRLYIYPIGAVVVKSGSHFTVSALVKNTGEFTEKDISVYVASCPVGFSCGSSYIPLLEKGKSKDVGVALVAGMPGERVISICAKSTHATYCREMIIRVLPQCSVDADCAPGEYCDNGICTAKKPDGEKCSAKNECKSNVCVGGYCARCETSGDCAANEQCSGGSCIKITCPCGTISSHTCIPYECCSDVMCSSGNLCIASRCVEKEIALLVVKGVPVEGQDLLVRVENNKGMPIPFALVTTADGQAITADENGYATVRVPYDGIIRATAEGYPQAAVMLDVTRLGKIAVDGEVYVGVPARILVTDSMGKPIVGATILVNGREYVTNANGEVWVVFDKEGLFVLSGTKEKYLIADANAMVVQPEKPACGFPILISVLWFVPKNIWVLWVFTMLVALVNIAIYTRRKREGRKLRAFIYFLLPILLAIPDVCIFSICFMSNVVVLQLLVELLIIMRNRVMHRHERLHKGRK
ncbi:MAG: hypothetical protein N3G76_01610 [Candidatus Micrarchaeota archaeon]|nr:hypothetical protein [Candidatus Micrarchaeota archaeon]